VVNKKAGNNKSIKDLNKSSILDLIRIKKAVSKAELSSLTGLSANAVGMITSALLKEGHIQESGIGKSSGGRKPVLFTLKPKSFYSIGIDFETDFIKTIAIDSTGDTVSEIKSIMPSDKNIAKVLSIIEKNINELMKKNQIETSRLLGIGLSVPGLIDNKTGRIVIAPNLGWNNIDLRVDISRIFDVPVYIENEALASSICEKWVGKCQHTDDFVCINVKSGIGAGIFTNGHPYRGFSGSAGEVGHIVVQDNGPLCGCGNHGCLETLASTAHILENTKKLLKNSSSKILSNIADDDLTFDDIVNAAYKGDELALNALIKASKYLAIGIANIINTMNPEKVIIGKEFLKFSELVLDDMRNIINQKSLETAIKSVSIEVSDIGEKTSTLGAAIIPLKSLFRKFVME
jgi:N-acetylglucosamine repressor